MSAGIIKTDLKFKLAIEGELYSGASKPAGNYIALSKSKVLVHVLQMDVSKYACGECAYYINSFRPFKKGTTALLWLPHTFTSTNT